MRPDTPARIKNLSIALEALSRINGEADLFINMKNMLLQEMDTLYREQHPPMATPVTETMAYMKPRPTKLDDEIPF